MLLKQNKLLKIIHGIEAGDPVPHDLSELAAMQRAQQADDENWQTSHVDLMQRRVLEADTSSAAYIRNHSKLSGTGAPGQVDVAVSQYLNELQEQ